MSIMYVNWLNFSFITKIVLNFEKYTKYKIETLSMKKKLNYSSLFLFVIFVILDSVSVF